MEQNLPKDWTIDEARKLIRLWVATESIILVSMLMDRTPSSIQTRALRLQLPSRELDEYYRRRWTPEEDIKLLETFKQGGVDIFVLSKNMQRTVDALISRANKKHGINLTEIKASLVLPDIEEMTKNKAIGEKGARERDCPRCLKPYWSSWIGHRVCLVCKGSDDWQDAL